MTPTTSKVMSTDLITVKAESDLKVAFNLLQKHRIRHLPVTDDLGSIIGIISDRDLNRAARSDLFGISENGCIQEQIDFDSKATVRDYMSWPVRSFSTTSDVSSVATAMIREKVSSYLIADDNIGKVVGIVTSEDLLKLLIELLKGSGNPKKTWDIASIIREGDSLFHYY